MDYLIADRIVVPEADRRHYDEAVVHLPDTYQPNDSLRAVADEPASRSANGLPEGAFVFCCFNNAYKITPHVFDAWMRLLAAVPGSVLWLFEIVPESSANLVERAGAHAIGGDRLVFARHVELGRHLARLRLADLVLDTLPYNAHTTASDALWAGVPMITCVGRTFPGRVGASLLSAIGLPELITTTPADYEALALRLARSPDELAALRVRLASQRGTAPLFDTDRYRLHIEAAYLEMVRRDRLGLPPAPITVPACRPAPTPTWHEPVTAGPGAPARTAMSTDAVGQTAERRPRP
jgi:predicted O-linked N-acetylglucosamine transferase (SPINDLY family)